MCLLRILSCHGIADPNIYRMYLTNNSKFYRFLFVCVFVYFAVYVAETATPKMRGLLGACVQLMVFFLFSLQSQYSLLLTSLLPMIMIFLIIISGRLRCNVGDSDGSD